MGLKHAVDAYRQSAYQNVEYDIEASVSRSGSIILGGVGAKLKKLGNTVMMPPKTAFALVGGGQYPESAVERAEIPDDIKGTKYAEALTKMREHGRDAADLKAESVEKFLNLDISGGLRTRRAAKYDQDQVRRVVLPDEGPGIAESMAGALAMAGGRMAVSSLVGGGTGGDFADLGGFTPQSAMAMGGRLFKGFGA